MRFSSFEDMLNAYSASDRIALYYENKGKIDSLTFYELAKKVSVRFQELISSQKTSIGIFCSQDVDTVVTIFAAAKAKMQLVMLDDGASDEILAEQIKASDVDMLFSTEGIDGDFKSYLTNGVEKNADRILFFTSGTTGSSKAVVLTQKTLMASAFNGGEKLPLGKDDVLLSCLPLSHVFGFVCSLLWGLSSGASVALGRGIRYLPLDFAFFRPSVVSLVPMMLGFLIKGNLLNPELKTILIGAGDCPPSLISAAENLGKKVSFGYGLTETSSGVAISVDGDPFAMEICTDDQIKIADDGEVLIYAPTCVMQGYYKDKKSTDQVLKNGWLYSGDLGYLDEQNKLHITGRKKEILVLSSGTKIFLPEYESALFSVLNKELVVIQINDRPVLVVKAEPRDYDEVKTVIKNKMADYPRAQQITDIIFTDKPFPRTSSGKIKRWEIQKTEAEKHG